MRLLPVLLLIAMPVQAAETGWTPKPDQVTRLERKLILPKGARPLRDYARYYWGTTEKSSKIIRGALVFGERKGIHITPPPLLWLDGGCNKVFVFFDLSKDTVTAKCDGVA